MKLRTNLHLLIAACLTLTAITSCNGDKHGRQITGYRELTVTVASTKLPGVVFSCGNNYLTDVYAVKTENSDEWEQLDAIARFDYEEGNEYCLRISKTDYLDYEMGEPAWTEYDLLEILSKEQKTSENLPPHFIPEWYFKDYCGKVNPDFTYAIQADNKADIEKDIQADASYKFDGLDLYVSLPTDYWFILDSDMKTQQQGVLIRKNINPEELPDTYKLLAPGHQVRGCQQFDFITDDPETPELQYIAFFYDKPAGKSPAAPQSIGILLYKDLTAHYQAKYPEAGITAVVLRYDLDATIHYILE
ncbi:MAG: DUF4377 domain-containing protein [Alistipes sp.]|nr:DUF4377 domain-containing protein [Alistipes sp.]